MSTLTTRRNIDAKGAMAIVSKRSMIQLTDIGKTLRFHVQGNGNIIPAMKNTGRVDATGKNIQEQALSFDGKSPLMKRIYNLRVNSQMAMQNPRNQAILQAALQAEAAGNEDEASDLINQYLNKVQVSFSYLINTGVVKEFYDGQLVEGEVTELKTDNGTTIVLENVRAVAIAKAVATPAFTISDLLGTSAEAAKPTDVFIPTAGATATTAAGTEKS